MRIVIGEGGVTSFKLFDDNGQEVKLRIFSADICLRPNEYPSATLGVFAHELDVSLLPKDITIIPIEDKE